MITVNLAPNLHEQETNKYRAGFRQNVYIFRITIPHLTLPRGYSHPCVPKNSTGGPYGKDRSEEVSCRPGHCQSRGRNDPHHLGLLINSLKRCEKRRRWKRRRAEGRQKVRQKRLRLVFQECRLHSQLIPGSVLDTGGEPLFFPQS